MSWNIRRLREILDYRDLVIQIFGVTRKDITNRLSYMSSTLYRSICPPLRSLREEGAHVHSPPTNAFDPSFHFSRNSYLQRGRKLAMCVRAKQMENERV